MDPPAQISGKTDDRQYQYPSGPAFGSADPV
jgi:hypothetical protein